MHHDNTINVLPLKNISGLPMAHSNVDKERLTHFPVSLSDTVRPVMEPSSCISLEESLEAGRPPRHFTTHTVFDLTRLQKEQTIQQFNKTFFFSNLTNLFEKVSQTVPSPVSRYYLSKIFSVLFQRCLCCQRLCLPLKS